VLHEGVEQQRHPRGDTRRNWIAASLSTSVGKIRKIYEAVKEAYEQKFYEAAKEKLEGHLREMAEKAIEGEAGLNIRQAIDIVEHMARGLRPIYDEKTGEISYETWLEF